MECISEHFGANMPQAWSLSKRYHGSTSDRSNMTRCIFLAMQIQHLPFLHIEIPLCSQSFESWHYEDFEETMSCLSIFVLSFNDFNASFWIYVIDSCVKSSQIPGSFSCTNRHNSASRAQLKSKSWMPHAVFAVAKRTVFSGSSGCQKIAVQPLEWSPWKSWVLLCACYCWYPEALKYR